MHIIQNRSTSWKRIGQYCPNSACDYIVKDSVELGDEKGEVKDE